MAKSLGSIGFRKRGDFSPNTFYRMDDMFKHGRSTYYAKEDFTSGETFEETADKVELLADATGVEEVAQRAEAAANLAEANGAEAGVQAEAAKTAADEANKQAETAKEVTEVFGGNFKKVINDNYLYAIGDLLGNLLWGIRKDGSAYQPKGVPEMVKKLIEEVNKRIDKQEARIHVVDNPNYLFAIADATDNLLFGIDRKGASFVNAIKGVVVVTKREDKQFIFALTDSAGNLLFGVRHDGTFACSKFSLPPAIMKQLEQAVKNKHMSTEADDQEYIYRLQDKDGKILFGVKWDGTSYMPKGIPLEQAAKNKKMEKRISSLEDRLANFKGGTGDWSESGRMQVPIPRLAMLNLLTGTMPTAKSGMGTSGVNCDIPCMAEFWDMQGNYFKLPILLSAQGNSSMGFIKKNLAIDLFADKARTQSYTVKFGDWVSQDSYHLKAYYTDTFRGVGAVSYMLYEEMAKTRDLGDDRPYKKAFTSKYGTSDNGLGSEESLDNNFDTGAKCFPMGFPVIVYQNGEFYGVYSWQLKKHRDNMHQNKKTAEHIHLDGTLGAASIFGGTIDWTQFEVRNPKGLYMQEKQTIRGVETLEYNGDYPREIMGDDAADYDSKNKDMKRCATVKKYIIALSGRMDELKHAETAGKSADEMKALIEKYFNVSFLIDYILETNLGSDGDGYNKNWQWTTYDGVLWNVNPYDHDGIFGAYHIGNYVSAPGSGWLGNTTTIPSGWIIKYYLPELKARWAELRKKGIFDAKHIAGLLHDWCDRIGYDNWDAEYTKWNESPCNRPSLINDTYWTRISGYTTAWVITSTYGKNSIATRNGKTYKSLVAGNVGIDPATDDGSNWENVTYDAGKEYAIGDVCYYGSSNFYGFKCLAACTGQPPLTGFYNAYPKELGHFDSVYRVENWLKQRIAYMDKLLDYAEA